MKHLSSQLRLLVAALLLVVLACPDRQMLAEPTIPSPPPRSTYSFNFDEGEWPGAEQYFEELSGVQEFHIEYGPMGLSLSNQYPGQIPIEIIHDLRKLPQLAELSIQSGRLTRDGVEAIGKLSSLKRLDLGLSRSCVYDFELLADLKQLEEFAFRTDLHPSCFITLAKLPKLRRIQVRGNGDHFPHHVVNDKIKQAITSMDGRLEEFDAGADDPADYGNYFGPGVARELFKISSLKVLKFDTPKFGLTLEDAKLLQSLNHLEAFTPGAWEAAEPRQRDEIKRILDSVSAAARDRTESRKSTP